MSTDRDLSRRTFLAGACAAAAGTAVLKSGVVGAAHHGGSRFQVGGFTKEYQSLSYEETAEAVAKIGWDGIECPVRPGGHVLPERVEEDLPKMVDALKDVDKELLVMASDIHNPDEKYTEPVLKTASALGIKYYRIGYWEYEDRPVADVLADITAELRDLEAMNKQYDICGFFQNHSGGHAVGAPVWDAYETVKDRDPRYVAIDFDIGHATVEGGYAWPIHFNRIASHLRGVVVKDFNWVREAPGERPEVHWCPIGDGMIERRFCGMLKETDFHGPVIMHHEYEVEGRGAERIENLIKAMKIDNDTLREWLA